MSEVWKDIKGYEGLYQVSNKGRVKSLDRYSSGRRRFCKGQFLRENNSFVGYPLVHLSKYNVKKGCRVHRLVIETFVPAVEGKKLCNHIDGDKLNNHADNLEWCTHSENTTHAHAEGLIKYNNTSYYYSQHTIEGEYIRTFANNGEIREAGFVDGNVRRAIRLGRSYLGYKFTRVPRKVVA